MLRHADSLPRASSRPQEGLTLKCPPAQASIKKHSRGERDRIGEENGGKCLGHFPYDTEPTRLSEVRGRVL